MSMSELEARCMNNLHTLRSELPDSRMVIPDISIVKAVLAEAGVAELVEVLTHYACHAGPSVPCMRFCPGIGRDGCGKAAGDALAKIGANQ